MTNWQIHIPHRSSEDTLADVAIAASHLEAEDAAVTRELIADLLLSSDCHTAGDVTTVLAVASPAERRLILDSAREAAGLESATAIDDRERFAMIQQHARRNASGRDAEGKLLQGCAAEGCSAMPLGATGLPEPVADRRWWCAEHRHLADADDHVPPDDVVAIGPNFELIPAPSVRSAMKAKDDRRRAEDERRNRERQDEAEAIQRARERYYEANKDNPYVNPFAGPGWRAAP
jgi:hypothetical protein